MRIRLMFALAVTIPLLTSCFDVFSTTTTTSNDAANNSNPSDNQAETLFPINLALSSPTEVVEEDAEPVSASLKLNPDTGTSQLTVNDLFNKVRQWFISAAVAAAPKKVQHYTWATLRIEALLKGAMPIKRGFVPELFLVRETNAHCFGPSLDYQDHPDAGIPNSGQLPTGDLGIWTEIDAATGHACAAAQLNARLRGVSWRSNMALMGLASMIGQMITDGISFPSAGNTVDVTALMNSLGVTDVTFSTASLSLDTPGTTWTYLLNFTYIDPSSISHDIEVKLQHTPGTTSNQYWGSSPMQ